MTVARLKLSKRLKKFPNVMHNAVTEPLAAISYLWETSDDAGVAQWQSSGFVNHRLEVQFLSPAPSFRISELS